MRAKLSWLTHARPEIAHFVNTAAQVTEEKFDLSHVKSMNSTIKALKKTAERKLLYQNLELKTLRIVSYSDASFAINKDLTSQLGFIIFLTDKTGRCNLVHASSHKCRRDTRSILGGEVLALADDFDYAFTLCHDLEHMLGKSIPLSMLNGLEKFI
jgi:hypothetical protein